MKESRKSHIVLTILAILAAGVLFATYGTVLPSLPFVSVQFDGPIAVDSDGDYSAMVDTESRRVLIMNSGGDLTGVVSCTTIDSPVDAVTDVCVSGGLVYVSGVRYKPDSEIIDKERVAVYDKGGNYQGTAYEMQGEGIKAGIKSLSNAPEGVVVACEKNNENGPGDLGSSLTFYLVNMEETKEIGSVESLDVGTFGVAVAPGDSDTYRYAILNERGVLDVDKTAYPPQVYEGHVYTYIDIGEDGTLYACDDSSGSLVAIAPGSSNVNTLLNGMGYYDVHVNNGVISTCNREMNKVTLCDTSGKVLGEFSNVAPSVGFSMRMLVVQASGIYLVLLILVLGIRKLYRIIKEGKTSGIGPVLAAVTVAIAIAVAVGSLSFASYKNMLDVRTSEIKMCADYLDATAQDLSGNMEKIDNRDAFHRNGEALDKAAENISNATYPISMLVYSANENDIGLYFSLYAKDDKGIFFVLGSSSEYIMGSSAHDVKASGLQDAFDGKSKNDGELLRGRTLRDTTQYQLVQIPTSDGKGVAGVIEIGSKTRSFEASITGKLAQRILGLLVLLLVVYLTYSELRTCGRCLFSFRQRLERDGDRAVALLTRPFTFCITLLTSIDSVMTVLIARDLLSKSGMGESSPFLAVPAVMLGIGLIAGQGLYSVVGPRVGARKLVFMGALGILACALFTIFSVASGNFWVYCVAKLLMSVPLGLLYVLGYSLPRIAPDDEMRAQAAGGVKRTDNSAAALGTVLGGYAAQALGNMWVYALVAVASLPVFLIAINLLPRAMQPVEKLAQPDSKNGLIRDFVKTPMALGLALFIVLPATLAAGYSSFLFPLFSSDLGMSKAEVNNVVVLGQLVVYVLIGVIERTEGRYGKWKVSMVAIALLGVVFLLFAVKTTLVWSFAVIALVGVLGKTSDGWKAMWIKGAGACGVPAGSATSAMYATRSLTLIVQPFVMGALLGATDAVAVIVLGVICAVCAALFFLVTRRTVIVKV